MPIPKTLLIHTVTVIENENTNIWGKTAITNQTVLSNVRVEPYSALTVDNQNNQIKLSAVLIYDCKNSTPSDFEFTHTQKINFNGLEYNISSIENLFDEQKLHHKEVSLYL